MQDLAVTPCYVKPNSAQCLVCFMLLHPSECAEVALDSGGPQQAACQLVAGSVTEHDGCTAISPLQIGMFILLTGC